MALIRTLTILTTTFENMKEKFYGFWQTEWSNWFETRHVDLAKFFNMDKGPIIFFVCVCVGGEVNFEGEGEQKKSRFGKGGNKVWPKYGKGGKELRIRPGGNTFFDNLNV